MVTVSLETASKKPRIRRRGGSGSGKVDYERVLAAVLALVGTLVFLWLVWQQKLFGSRLASSSMMRSKPNHPDLGVNDPNSQMYNAVAQDILTTLDCASLLDTTTTSQEGLDRRRLDETELLHPGDPGAEAAAGDAAGSLDNFDPAMDDFGGGEGGGLHDEEEAGADSSWRQVTAARLFCLSAHATSDDVATGDWKTKVQCDYTAKQQSLLDLWSTARAEISSNDDSMLKQVLELATETERTLVGTTLHLWSPNTDEGLEYMLNELNKEKDADAGGIAGLEHNLGLHKVFVDVGSCLGLTSMAVALLYPGTKIVSMEAASPNWLLQELNWRCNADKFTNLDMEVILGGVGPQHGEGKNGKKLSAAAQMAKFTWRAQSTTSTRSWTPRSEQADSDVELQVKLKPWHSLLALAGMMTAGDVSSTSPRIDVLNVDCEGCEYNLIPALTDAEFDSISTVIGGVHWGYIPPHKLPSSERASKTHSRLCKHENIARGVKECCAFPNLPVISAVPGEVLLVAEDNDKEKQFPPKAVTVKDVIAPNLCDDFDEWAKEKHLFDVESDWGWFQITSMAD